MSTFNEKDLASLDPKAIRVRIKEPEEFMLNAGASSMTLDLVAKKGGFNDRFKLEQVSLDRASMPGGLFSSEMPVRVYTLRLTAESQDKFRRLQSLVADSKVESFAIRIEPVFNTGPKEPASIRVWTEIMLKPQQGYLLTIDGLDVPIGKTIKAET